MFIFERYNRVLNTVYEEENSSFYAFSSNTI